jgi:hypothetical protein
MMKGPFGREKYIRLFLGNIAIFTGGCNGRRLDRKKSIDLGLHLYANIQRIFFKYQDLTVLGES